MTGRKLNSEFPKQTEENRVIWDANVLWWDDKIGDGNEHQTVLIAPATERLLGVNAGDVILDGACGAGRFARRMAELGAHVVAFDYSEKFIERARERTDAALTSSSTSSMRPSKRTLRRWAHSALTRRSAR